MMKPTPTPTPASPIDATSDSADSYDGPVGRSGAPTKKRKPTYYVRKEEKEQLEKEIDALQERIRQLEATQHISAKIELDNSIALNALLSSDVEINNMALAGAQSLLSAEMVSRFHNPMDHYIYLPQDDALRRQSLLSLKPLKVTTARQLIHERMRFLDITQAHRHCETTQLNNGDFVLTFFDVTQFPAYTNARVVFDEFITFVTSQEISISESLGIIAIRETDDCAESSVSQCRLLSTIAPGIEIESNLAMMSRFEESQDGVTPAWGVGTVDYVDKDDLYPYQTATRLRKDLSACAYITQTDRVPDEMGGTERGVIMARFATIRLHRPSFIVDKQMEMVVQESVEKWCDVMPRVMKARLGL